MIIRLPPYQVRNCLRPSTPIAPTAINNRGTIYPSTTGTQRGWKKGENIERSVVPCLFPFHFCVAFLLLQFMMHFVPRHARVSVCMVFNKRTQRGRLRMSSFPCSKRAGEKQNGPKLRMNVIVFQHLETDQPTDVEGHILQPLKATHQFLLCEWFPFRDALFGRGRVCTKWRPKAAYT